MKFRVPFTSLYLGFKKPTETATKSNEKRGLAFGEFFAVNASRNMLGRDQRIDFKTAYYIYQRQTDVYSTIRAYSDNVGLEGWEFYNPKDETKEVSQSQKEELKTILEYEQPFEEFKNIIVRDLGITGNAYANFITAKDERTVLGLQILDPRSIALVMDKHGVILTYIQRVGGHKPILFDPSEIIHFRLGRDPNNVAFGYSPLESIIWEALTDLEATKSNLAFFENDAKPSVVYILEDEIEEDEEESKKVMDKITNQFSGAKNKHKAAILSGVKEIKTIGSTQKEMEFLEQRRFATEKVCAAFGVPKFMLGYTETVNNNNGVELTKIFTKKIITLENMFERTLNLAFNNKLKKNKDQIAFRFKPQSLEDPAEMERRGIDMYSNGVMTLRETKNFLGHEVLPEHEKIENFDSFVLHRGGSASKLEDVGTDAIVDPNNNEKSENFIKSLSYIKQNTQ